MIYINGKKATEFHMENTAIALGKFDGIHLGHQLLLDGLKQEKQNGRNTLVFTFGFEKLDGKSRPCIYTEEEKIYYFNSFGIDVLLEYPFTKEFSQYSPKQFIGNCLVEQLGVKSVYVGKDFHFGKNRSGDIHTLIEYGDKCGFEVHAIEKRKLNDEIVSSTRIRECIVSNFSSVNELLGNPYFVYGEIVHGNHIGNTIGFPTINQLIPEDKIVPNYGVYASKVCIDNNWYSAISNLGKKPTIEGIHQLGLETHILDFSGDLYGKKVQTQLLEFVRPEMKFDGIDHLTEQIQKDVEKVKSM